MSNWTKWLGIESIHSRTIRNSYRWPGVYKIRIVDSMRNPLEIVRFLAPDKNGILAIGESKNIAQRISQFRSAFNGREFKHSVANRLFLIRYLHRDEHTIINNIIEFKAMKLNGKPEAMWEEERLLKVYFKIFGELPPFNGSMPDKHPDIDWKEL